FACELAAAIGRAAPRAESLMIVIDQHDQYRPPIADESRVLIRPTPDGVTVTVPPLQPWEGSHPRRVVSAVFVLFLVVIMTALGILAVCLLVGRSSHGDRIGLVVALIWLAIALYLAWLAVHELHYVFRVAWRRWIELTVAGGRLTVESPDRRLVVTIG